MFFTSKTRTYFLAVKANFPFTFTHNTLNDKHFTRLVKA